MFVKELREDKNHLQSLFKVEFENKLTVTKAGGGINQELRINMHMLLHRR